MKTARGDVAIDDIARWEIPPSRDTSRSEAPDQIAGQCQDSATSCVSENGATSMRRDEETDMHAFVRALVVLATVAVLPTLSSPAGAVPPGAVQLGFPAIVSFAGSDETRADAIALQEDGRILMVGSADFAPNAIAVARTLADGTPDASFDGDGRLLIAPGILSGGSASALGGWVGVMADGRIAVVGSVFGEDDENGGLFSILVARLMPDGSFDTSFSQDGRVLLGGVGDGMLCGSLLVTQSLGSPSARCPAVLEEDGSQLLGAQLLGSGARTGVLKLRPNGTMDPGFGNNGRRDVTAAIAAAGGTFVATADMLRSGDGSLILAGFTRYDFSAPEFAAGLARVRADGSVDTAFGMDGELLFPDIYPLPHSIARDHRGGYIVGLAAITQFGKLFGAARFGSDGRVDTDFGSDGIATAIPASQCNGAFEGCHAHAMHVDRAGRAFVVGSVPQPPADSQEDADLAIVRFTAQGMPDTSWGTGGTRIYGNDLVLPPTSFIFQESGNAVALDSVGRLVIAGSALREEGGPPVETGMSLWKIWSDESFADGFE